jgi:hypothetical protein
VRPFSWINKQIRWARFGGQVKKMKCISLLLNSLSYLSSLCIASAAIGSCILFSAPPRQAIPAQPRSAQPLKPVPRVRLIGRNSAGASAPSNQSNGLLQSVGKSVHLICALLFPPFFLTSSQIVGFAVIREGGAQAET